MFRVFWDVLVVNIYFDYMAVYPRRLNFIFAAVRN
jgi:hypothetical protein